MIRTKKISSHCLIKPRCQDYQHGVKGCVNTTSIAKKKVCTFSDNEVKKCLTKI